MEQNVETEVAEATPIFGAYRRGYDPVQVDRYVADQQRRLDVALTRASEAERKLAAAVGQLRELHRRVAVLESEDRSPQPAPLDALGERVQRILQEAWEGAYALRQQAETEASSLREEVAGEAASTIAAAEQHADGIVEAAERRVEAIDAEIERRRLAWNARLEEDRSKAVAQITHLHTQRNEAVGDLLRLRAMIEKAVQDLGSVGAVAAVAPAAAALGDVPFGFDHADASAGETAQPLVDAHSSAGTTTAADPSWYVGPALAPPAPGGIPAAAPSIASSSLTTAPASEVAGDAAMAARPLAPASSAGEDAPAEVTGTVEPAVRVQRPRTVGGASRAVGGASGESVTSGGQTCARTKLRRTPDDTVAVRQVPEGDPPPEQSSSRPVFDFEEVQPS